MKKLALCVALAVMATGAMAKEWKTVRIGVDASYPPFESKAASGQVVGFDVDLTKALCARMNVKCVWVEQDFDGIIPALKGKKFDAIVSSLTVTDKLFDAPARMIARAGSPLLPTADSLKGKRVGVEQGTTQEAYAKAYWEPKGVTVVPYQNQDQVYADLTSGRLDAALQDEIQAGPEVKDPKTIGEGTAIGLRKDDAELKAMFNKALAQVHQDGTFRKLEKQYFDFEIYPEH
ncbi:MAG: ABC transporter, substrate-binding protein (cluster 3, basic aa/glutamine/opines) [uncultured Paraburkholderia sp.]|nr:MAG: ABC transporter, substrate-binding protein (cluster 3, basic aa/glutamine/opines) [uncultured Paraburkholderia sp.]CAH2934169.1 MAG: ABC transporter, substrate-binding protein (cluster 3, basic aa/glutamine/opines) [uncultured Paraburkholderia sp.]